MKNVYPHRRIAEMREISFYFPLQSPCRFTKAASGKTRGQRVGESRKLHFDETTREQSIDDGFLAFVQAYQSVRFVFAGIRSPKLQDAPWIFRVQNC
jgi:hypothetical protein